VRNFILSLAILVFVVSTGAGKSDTTEALAEAFGTLPFAYYTRLSPDGSKVSFLHHHADRDASVVIVFDLAQGKSRPVLASDPSNNDITWCEWANEERLLCGARRIIRDGYIRYPITRLMAINADGSDFKMLLQHKLQSRFAQFQDEIVDWLVDDPRKVLVEIPGADGTGVAELDIYSGKTSRKLRRRAGVWSYLTDGHGDIRLYRYVSDKQREWRYRMSDNDSWKVLTESAGNEKLKLWPLGFGEALDEIYVTGQHEGRLALWSRDLKNDNELSLIFAHPEVDVGGMVRLGKYNRIVGVTYTTEATRIHFFDELVEQATDRLHDTFPDRMITIIDESWDRQFYLFAVNSDRETVTYYRYNVAENLVEALYEAYPLLANKQWAETAHHLYKARDGAPVPAYVTLPNDRKPEALPAVILPHGGPSSRDVWDFDWLAQFFAAKGYVVLQPNYRGSSGYGEAWEGEGGFRAWRTAINDITDGTNYLIKEGVVDAGRICIIGWSYGGYAALMSSLEEPDLYQCAISIAGVTDTETLWRDSKYFIGGSQTRHFIGKGDEIFEEGSPLERAQEFTVPVLLLHREEDYDVPVKHSEDLAEELDEEGKDHDLVIYENADHGLGRNAARIDMLNRIGHFLDHHIGEQAKTSSKTRQASASAPSGP
jgi:dipeptidyl aminopeptidase/acylaminoacyl peptidase